jgi:WD40 repeat protein
MIRLYETASGKELNQLVGDNQRADAVAFSPDGKLLITGGWDSMIRLWEPRTGKKIREMKEHEELFALAFTPDGSGVRGSRWDYSLLGPSPRQGTFPIQIPLLLRHCSCFLSQRQADGIGWE